MLVVRHNFETNSSSMHSLSFRKESGPYTAEELKHSEALARTHYHDAIITLNDGHTVTKEEIYADGWIWDNQMRVWKSDLNLRNSAMQVMSSFRDKMIYALATVYGYQYKNWEKRVDEIKAVFAKYLPNVQLNMDYIEKRNAWYRSGSVNQYLLYPFLKQNKISIEEFITNTKYLVIVDYSEYQKMCWLNMVDESKIESVCHPDEEDECAMVIENGVWRLGECDINFGRSPFRVLGTPEGKARYALASYRGRNVDEVLAIMQEVYPDMKEIEFPRSEWDGEIEYGYCEDSALPHDVPLRDFILDKKYVIISDGDEYCIWDSFKKTPLFNREEYPDEKAMEDEYDEED